MAKSEEEELRKKVLLPSIDGVTRICSEVHGSDTAFRCAPLSPEPCPVLIWAMAVPGRVWVRARGEHRSAPPRVSSALRSNANSPSSIRNSDF
eukprot:1205501-Rhodomonas_salina.1